MAGVLASSPLRSFVQSPLGVKDTDAPSTGNPLQIVLFFGGYAERWTRDYGDDKWIWADGNRVEEWARYEEDLANARQPGPFGRPAFDVGFAIGHVWANGAYWSLQPPWMSWPEELPKVQVGNVISELGPPFVCRSHHILAVFFAAMAFAGRNEPPNERWHLLIFFDSLVAPRYINMPTNPAFREAMEQIIAWYPAVWIDSPWVWDNPPEQMHFREYYTWSTNNEVMGWLQAVSGTFDDALWLPP